jgi:hypothetical protein
VDVAVGLGRGQQVASERSDEYASYSDFLSTRSCKFNMSIVIHKERSTEIHRQSGSCNPVISKWEVAIVVNWGCVCVLVRGDRVTLVR